MLAKFDTACFNNMADQAKRLADHGSRLNSDAARTREAIENMTRQLESIDLAKLLASMRKFSELAAA
jgi:Rod binding domain-containing protein